MSHCPLNKGDVVEFSEKSGYGGLQLRLKFYDFVADEWTCDIVYSRHGNTGERTWKQEGLLRNTRTIGRGPEIGVYVNTAFDADLMRRTIEQAFRPRPTTAQVEQLAKDFLWSQLTDKDRKPALDLARLALEQVRA